ncbi:MAG: cobaltochelatase subunit CobT [Rhodospirillales bacterium]|nr:cobaltochelatase subunit CobT [Alphaproteobacteria bacterium]USO03131.1 MAG: cobaltochelatase subunit CobT [Rhodospirillales bacterium]
MDKTTDRNEKFKTATAAALRALAGKKNLDVTYTAGEKPEAPARPDKKAARLPLPSRDIPPEEKALLRGSADSRALRLKHHAPHLHLENAPMALTAAAAFDAMEQARCEAIGALQMQGVAQNLGRLLEDKGKRLGYDRIERREDSNIADALHALTRVALTEEPVPESLRPLFELWTPWVEEKLGCSLSEFFAPLSPAGRGNRREAQGEGDNIHDQKAFAELSKKLLREIGLSAGETGESEKTEETAEDGESEQEGGENGTEEQAESAAAAAAAAESEDDGSEENNSAAGTEDTDEDGSATDEDAEMSGDARQKHFEKSSLSSGGEYVIYTEKFDEVVKAEDLADPEELMRLRQMLDQQLAHLHGVIGKLANRLQRKLMARQQRSWKFDQDEGYIDCARLARVVANPTVPMSFKQERDTNFRDTVVTLLIDNSGSMRGRPIAIAAVCTDILARTLERCGVKVEILGFTTRAWKGGRARELWIENGRPPHPGRLNDLRHIIYKAADAPLRRARKNIGLMLKEGLLKENIDGEALAWAHNRLARRPEARKILIVISDGAPVDDSTLSVNLSNILERDLRTVIAWVEGLGQVELSAIGIGHDVGRYYARAMTIADADELAEALVKRLENLFHLDERKTR